MAIVAAVLLASPIPARARPPLVAGTVFRDCSLCPEMVVVPPGRFMMGPAAGEEERAGVPPRLRGHAGPAHPVVIASTFAVSRYEITNAGWLACRTTDHCINHLHDERPEMGRHPLVRLTWDDARSYTDWLSGWTKQSYRLATEAEWEYAARAGTTTARSWGEMIGTGQANCVGCGSPWDGRSSAPVGSFPANPFGLFDMLGNVSEWTADCWRDGYGAAPIAAAAAPAVPCPLRVVRGGAWASPPWNLRAARRVGLPPDFRHLMIGFRVVRDLDPPP